MIVTLEEFLFIHHHDQLFLCLFVICDLLFSHGVNNFLSCFFRLSVQKPIVVTSNEPLKVEILKLLSFFLDVFADITGVPENFGQLGNDDFLDGVGLKDETASP